MSVLTEGPTIADTIARAIESGDGAATMIVETAVFLVGRYPQGDWCAGAAGYDLATRTAYVREAVRDTPIDALKAAMQLEEREPWMDELAQKAGAL
jgi:hypothetical protein